jgi:Kef-type K+ transport system membrane component KefB
MDALIAEVIGDIALVLGVSTLLGGVARRLGQPTVVGQILAGILLGPSVLGRLPGHLTSRFFPPAVLPILTALAQVAIVIFMFVVGYELDRRSLRGRHRAVPFVAVCALLIPLSLGSGAVLALGRMFAAVGQPHFSQPFVLFMGVAMSITALPVLAAIVRERSLSGTVAGSTAMSAAGVMDVMAWLVLAVALVGTPGHGRWPWPVMLTLVSCFVLIMLRVVRPSLGWWISRPRSLLVNPLPVAVVLAMGSAWVTASMGLHPVFGGFLAGLAMPSRQGSPDPDVVCPMEQVSGLLLPLFFVVTGLSLSIGTLNGAAFALLAVVCAIASLGKLGPGYLASRLGGLGKRDAFTVAVLVNTRGLTELIVLNVGLTAGLLSQRLFTVMVLMALLMTVATAPLLSWARQPQGAPMTREPDLLPVLRSSRQTDT